MNYYPFHIGDYVSATRHLTWAEDAAYRRLLDTYYTTEKPLPAELRAVCRLVLASTDEQREAVRVVLDEFFELTGAGWINTRADAEIDAMRVKQSAQEDKDRHETDRMRRYRERRAAMFSALRAVEVVPAWDMPMKELQRLVDEHCNAPETQGQKTPETPATEPATHLQREQVVSGDAPATAISTNTNTNTNTNKEEGRAPRKRSAAPALTTSLVGLQDVPADLLADYVKVRAAKKAGALTQTAVDGLLREAGRAGVDVTTALRACCEYSWIGFNATWYAERQASSASAAGRASAAAETPYQRSMRERVEAFSPAIARRAPGAQRALDVIEPFDVEVRDVTAIAGR